MDRGDARRQLLSALRTQVQCVEGLACPQDRAKISSGCPALDALLPHGGFHGGQLVEWFAARPASGAGTLALRVAREAATEGRAIVVLDCHGKFYPPAAAAWKLDLRRLIVVQPRREADAMWALDQALRCPAVAAVWAETGRIEPRVFRRLQLAAEESGCLGLLLRPATAVRQPSWSDMQLWVEPLSSVAGRKTGKRVQPSDVEGSAPFCQSQPSDVKGSDPFCQSVLLFQPSFRRWRLQMLRCRGSAIAGHIVELEMDEASGGMRVINTDTCSDERHHETGSVPLASQLAHPTPRQRAARA